MTTLLCRITRCGLKNAPASMKIWESGDGRFEKSSAAQCYPVKCNRAEAPVSTLTTATCICNFAFPLYLSKLMAVSLNVKFIVSTGNVGCITATLGSTLLIAAQLIQVLLFIFSRKNEVSLLSLLLQRSIFP